MKKYLPTSYAAAAIELTKQGYAHGDIAQVLLHHLKKAKRLSQLPSIIAELDARARVGDGTVIDVYTAHTLSAEQKQQVASLAKKLFAPDVALRTHEDSALVGGITLRNGDEVIDFSVSTLVSQLHTHLKKE